MLNIHSQETNNQQISKMVKTNNRVKQQPQKTLAVLFYHILLRQLPCDKRCFDMALSAYRRAIKKNNGAATCDLHFFWDFLSFIYLAFFYAYFQILRLLYFLLNFQACLLFAGELLPL